MKFITILFVKSSTFILKLLGRGGSLPGQLALKLNRNILKKLKFDGPLIVVTGTNGKTSTANLIDDMLSEKYEHVISNRKGDNMSYGIATTILSNTSFRGRVKADALVLEVDELNMPFVMSNVAVSHVVVTNFFRDQLDRAQEMGRIIQTVSSSLRNFEGQLVLNAHDVNVMSLSIESHANIISYGVRNSSTKEDHKDEANDGKFCPKCNGELTYAFQQYSHIGEFHCNHCGFESPDDAILATVVSGEDFVVEDEEFTSSSTGLYSIYNCMAVIAVATTLNIEASYIRSAFLKAERPIGRNEMFQLQHSKLVLNLIKNPTGANEVLKVIEAHDGPKQVVIVCNDNSQDGKDVSWLYDTQFDRLDKSSTLKVICSGLRAYDMALRLKYAGMDTNKILVLESVEEAVGILKDVQDDVFVLTTYTALVPTRKQIERYQK